MEIVQGILVIVYLFLLVLWAIANLIGSWLEMLAYVLLPGLLLGVFMQRLDVNHLGAFLAAEGLLLIFDTLFNPHRTFLNVLLNIRNLASIDGFLLIAVMNLICVLPFLIAIRLGYILSRRIRHRQIDAIKP